MTAQPLTILVTGSSSGFGRVISEELARDRGTTLEVIELDVEVDASVDRAVARAVAGREGIDVLVNNAGGWVCEQLSLSGQRAMTTEV